MYIQTVPYFCWSFQHYFFNIKAQPNAANGHPAHFLELSRSVATADSKLVATENLKWNDHVAGRRGCVSFLHHLFVPFLKEFTEFKGYKCIKRRAEHQKLNKCIFSLECDQEGGIRKKETVQTASKTSVPYLMWLIFLRNKNRSFICVFIY